MFANQISPNQSNRPHGNESYYPLHISEMGCLDVETGGLHAAEQRFNLPSFLISFYSVLWMVITDKDIDVELTELSVGAVHTQDKACLCRQQTEYHLCNDFKIKNVFCKETLESSHV